jgi:hypothetical protein
MDVATAVFPRKSGNVVERFLMGEGVGEFDDCDFALAADDHIDEGFAESLVRQQGRVPSAEDDREPWCVGFDCGSRLNGTADHRPGED